MKMLRSAACALAVIVATAGCHHKPVAVTPIPTSSPTGVTDTTSLPSTIPYNAPPQNPNGQPIPPVANSDLANYDQNPEKLAANTIHFAYDSAVIRDSDQANLQAVAQELQANPREALLVEGNCDERGTEEYNRSLGERRALAAREALAKLGVDPSRVHEISYGKDKPADPGHDEAAWAKNRRDDFVVLTPKMGA
ncbi:MAG TPA: OmpA family protein [Pseudomonadales bacterium]|nr:OmpA family protein [Pseudomonadales bacterium]